METWVTFKFIGLLGLQLLYVVIMMIYLVRIGAIKEDGPVPWTLKAALKKVPKPRHDYLKRQS